MCWDPQISGARERLSALYEAVRQRDDRAVSALLKLAVPELRGWLDRHFPRHGRVVDTLRIAEKAIEEVVLRASRLSSWAHAWAYAQKVAAHAVRRVRKQQKRACVLSLESVCVDIVDPRSARFDIEIESDDVIGAALAELSLSELEVLYVLVQRTGSLEESAKALNLNVRTLWRWRQMLLEKLSRALRGE